MTRTAPSPKRLLATALVLGALVGTGFSTEAQAQPDEDSPLVLGAKVRAGGRYDDVRMCVATDPDVKGGPAMDISLFAEKMISSRAALHIDLPFMRPILFAAAFQMLQFEPSITLKIRSNSDGPIDFVGGPMLGVSLHYGPDYHSDRSGADRGPSFFAIGPTAGAYLGLDFKRPDNRFNTEIGVTPFITPLFGVDDPNDHRGLVIGGLLDVSLRFEM